MSDSKSIYSIIYIEDLETDCSDEELNFVNEITNINNHLGYLSQLD